jgi:enolase
MTTAIAIASVQAWEALDSRGNPTVACAVVTGSGVEGVAVVPSGASVGGHEVLERRDGGTRYAGKGVTAAVAAVDGELAAAVRGLDAADQDGVDTALTDCDGTRDLSRLGGNAVLAVSLATLRAHAASTGRQLWQVLTADAGVEPVLPLPMVNILSGGAHAAGALDIQDVLAVPVGATDAATALEWVARVRRACEELAVAAGARPGLVADEGGIAPVLPSNRAAVELVHAGIERAGLRAGVDVAIAVDVAANRLARTDGAHPRYELALEGRTCTAAQWVDELADWARQHPLVSIEDPLHEDDWAGWTAAAPRLAGRQLLGDDLIATQLDRVDRAADAGANAVLVKVNQAGTVSAAKRVVTRARERGMATVVSARSGDTEDSWLTDLAIGWAAGQLKVGSTMRSERTAKWNRLLECEARFGLPFAGVEALAR